MRGITFINIEQPNVMHVLAFSVSRNIEQPNVFPILAVQFLEILNS